MTAFTAWRLSRSPLPYGEWVRVTYPDGYPWPSQPQEPVNETC